jgi:hypothetical protein
MRQIIGSDNLSQEVANSHGEQSRGNRAFTDKISQLILNVSGLVYSPLNGLAGIGDGSMFAHFAISFWVLAADVETHVETQSTSDGFPSRNRLTHGDA